MKTFNSGVLLNYPIYIQPKMNGISCRLTTDGLLTSRTHKYFPAVQKVIEYNLRPPFDLYGELYVHGWSLQRIVAAVTPDEPTEDTYGLLLYCYDCDLAGKNPKEKEEIISRLSGDFTSPYYRISSVTTVQTTDINDIYRHYGFYLQTGYEGIVIRDSLEQVWKMKPYTDSEYECVGVTEGLGKRTSRVGHFILKLPDGRQFNCGGGRVSYEKLKELYDNPPIGKLMTVRYNSLSDDGIPLTAQLISVRDYE